MSDLIFIPSGAAASVTGLIYLALWLWVVVVPPVVIPVRLLPVRGALGLALPGFILLTPHAWNEQVLRHELAHQRQMRRLSPLGASLLLLWHYGTGMLRGLWRDRRCPSLWSLWSTNPLEREANRAMHETTPLPPVLGWKETGGDS